MIRVAAVRYPAKAHEGVETTEAVHALTVMFTARPSAIIMTAATTHKTFKRPHGASVEMGATTAAIPHRASVVPGVRYRDEEGVVMTMPTVVQRRRRAVHGVIVMHFSIDWVGVVVGERGWKPFAEEDRWCSPLLYTANVSPFGTDPRRPMHSLRPSTVPPVDS